MIINLSKVLIYGLEKEVSRFFESAQKEGYIEFIGDSTKKAKEIPSSLKSFLEAISILKKQPVVKLKEVEEKYNAEEICEKIIQAKNNIDHLEDLKRQLEIQAELVAPLGDFSMKDIEYITLESNHVFQFYTLKSSKYKKEIPPELIYVRTEYDQDYFVAVNKEKKSYPGFVELFVEMPISVLKKRIAMVDSQLASQREKLKSFAVYISIIKERMIQKFDIYNLEIAKTGTHKFLEDTIFCIQAWIPVNKLEDFKKLIKGFSVDFATISVEKSDKVPTCFENKKLGRLGEDLVKIYDTPSTEDQDPSLWVMWFFTCFFAIIVDDGGYGLVLLLLALFLKFKSKGAKAGTKRFIKIMIFVFSACVVWGVFTASIFGISFAPTSKIQKISVMYNLSEKKADYHLEKKDTVYREWIAKYPKAAHATSGKNFLLAINQTDENHKVSYDALDTFSRNNLMELSLIIGIFHIFISFMKNLKRNWAGAGWCLFMLGGYLFFPSILDATSMVHFLGVMPKEQAFFIGRYLLFSGIAIAVVLALIQKRLGGISEIMNVVGVFGDVLSYLRLYALSLAGMILSQTFNNMALSLNFFLGFFIIVIGHFINISLCIMGGVIHGLRLNFLEWYNHCFEGGGKLFNPLKLFK